MQRYVDEFVFRFNTRNYSDSQRFDFTFAKHCLIYGKEEETRNRHNKIESVKLNINFSVPKEQFDELLRRMHI